MAHCKVCHHPSRTAIDAEIVAGRALRAIVATNPGLSLGGLVRHKEHIKTALRQAMESREGENAERSSALLNRVHRLVDEAEAILAIAKTKEDLRGANGALGAACKLLDLCARLSGELQQANAAAGSLHVHLNRVTNNTVINFDKDLAQLISEGTNHFNPTVIEHLKALLDTPEQR
jgi:hypothetical protein